MPICLGNTGKGRFFSGANRPSISNFCFSFSNASNNAPQPGALQRLDSELGIRRVLHTERPAPVLPPLSPSFGTQSSAALRLRNITQRTCAAPSFSEKYQCPEAARVRLEISPPTHSSGMLVSSSSAHQPVQLGDGEHFWRCREQIVGHPVIMPLKCRHGLHTDHQRDRTRQGWRRRYRPGRGLRALRQYAWTAKCRISSWGRC